MQRLHVKNIVWILAAIAGFILLNTLVDMGVINKFYQITLVRIMINIIFAVGLNLVLGVAGQFSLGHAGFIAIGGYAGAIFSKAYENSLQGMFIGMAVGVVISILLALIVGIPTLRLKGDYLAIATLGVAEIVRVFINNMKEITNGAAGISGIPIVSTWQMIYVFLVITTIFVLNYVYSSAGRATMAIQQDEIAAEAMGVNVTKYKVIAFVIGAITASIAGTLNANYIGIVTPGDYTFNKSIDVLIIVVFGGIGSFTGSFVAAILLGLLNVVLQDYGQLRMIIYGVAVILIMIFRPGGLLGTSELRLGSLVSKWVKGNKEVVR
ncbi:MULTISPECIES: branched-chain amino acid ABC transporter permease [unclassified Facklamia]|uniref:branched-chain amino acid ABC transporter permease n=1 Tax=Aerococcaceae TaxID=186827 RepID=UPI0013BC87E7|nr:MULTISPECIES: branched-chain amino acid ABC transporter permease [unclassified Facklamia]NEW64444.1 branched-chain amino acid ABC transporter permease [Facklamia sp. 252]NEW67651.1 branched-chain amino acid ABC transporter permease [Facklamia sp. 253]QQD65631.1 branched-chain amino acid ABC transporter permease [Aerococcaceae bacterium zg-252]